MKSLNVLLFATSVALFTVGCGGGDVAAPSAEEEKANAAAMEADMNKMSGNLGGDASDPGEGKTPSGDE